MRFIDIALHLSYRQFRCIAVTPSVCGSSCPWLEGRAGQLTIKTMGATENVMFKTTLIANSALSLAAALVWVSQAQAAQYDLGNPDLSMRWDNTLRYNLGIRAESRDDALAN